MPIEGADVLCRKGTEVFTRGQTNGSGQVTLYVSPITPGPMSVTVNAHNYFVHIDTCHGHLDRALCRLPAFDD